MKYAIIIPDGAPGEPLEALEGRTALEVARLPVLDALAARGRLGTAYTVADEPHPSEALAQLGVLGYAPAGNAAGVGALMAHARGLDVNPNDQLFCCDLVTVIDGYLRDHTAGFISAAEAQPLIEALNEMFGREGFRFHACGGNRNVCVWENPGDVQELQATPVELVVNRPIKQHMPRGRASGALCNLMLRAETLLREHDVNAVRQDLGENPATAIWLWGPGPLPTLPSFYERHGLRGALVTGSDVTRGIGRLIGWEVLDVAGATSLPDTDYSAKGRAAVDALDSFDLVCVQVQAPQTLGLLGNFAGKIDALEAIDRQIVAPVLKRLEAEPEWRTLVIAAQTGGRRWHPELAGRTLLVLAGSGVKSHRGEAFDEKNAVVGELHPDRASDLMEYFVRR